MLEIKVPETQFIIKNTLYGGKYFTSFGGFSRFVQEAKIYKTLASAKNALNQSYVLHQDTCEIVEVKTTLVDKEKWKEEELKISRSYLTEYKLNCINNVYRFTSVEKER